MIAISHHKKNEKMYNEKDGNGENVRLGGGGEMKSFFSQTNNFYLCLVIINVINLPFYLWKFD